MDRVAPCFGLLILSGALVACSAAPSPEPVEPVQTVEPTQDRDATQDGAPQEDRASQDGSTGHLVVGALRLVGAGGMALTVDENGRVEAEPQGTFIGTFFPDGRFARPGGETLIYLTEEGAVMLGDGPLAPRIENDALHDERNGGEITISEDGTFLFEGQPGNGSLAVEGVRPETRRLALFLLVVIEVVEAMQTQ